MLPRWNFCAKHTPRLPTRNTPTPNVKELILSRALATISDRNLIGGWILHGCSLIVTGSARPSSCELSHERTVWYVGVGLEPTQIEAKVQVMAYLIQLECMCFFWLSGRPTLLPTYSWTGNGVPRPRTPMR